MEVGSGHIELAGVVKTFDGFVNAVDHIGRAVKALAHTGELDVTALDFHADLSLDGLWPPRLFWIMTMVPRLAPMMMKETMVVTVPSA